MAKRQIIDKDFARYALQGIEAAIEKLQTQAAALRRSLGRKVENAAEGRTDTMGGVVTAEETATGRFGGGAKKRKMSAAGRRRISEAQKARWAKQKEQPSGRVKNRADRRHRRRDSRGGTGGL